MTRLQIPVVDLGEAMKGSAAARKMAAEQIDDAFKTAGFLVAVGHGVPVSLLKEMHAVSRRCFALPEAAKLKYKMPEDVYRGYTPFVSESLSYTRNDGVKTAGDLRESYNSGPFNSPISKYYRGPEAGTFFADNFFPSEVPGMEAIWSRYYRALHDFSIDFMRLGALGLGLDEFFFDSMVDRTTGHLAALYYPPLQTAAEQGQLRAGAHTDYGCVTMVSADNDVGGIEILSSDGVWLKVPHIENSFVINIGDLLGEWTNDRWHSTLHRVGLPDQIMDAQSDRQSIVFFLHPNYDAIVEPLPTCVSAAAPPRYRPVAAGAHLLGKIAKQFQPLEGVQR